MVVTRRAVLVLAAAIAVALAALAARRLLRAPPRDEDVIRTLFEDAARAAEERRPGDAVAGLSERFGGGGLDRDGARRLVAFHVLRGEWVSVGVAGARVVVEGDRARASVDAILARAAGRGKAIEALLPGEASAHRFLCRLEREREGWRIVAAEWRPIGLAEALAGPPEP
jgi:hypothetical protein